MTRNYLQVDFLSYVKGLLDRSASFLPSPFLVSAVGSGGKTSVLESLYAAGLLPYSVLTTTTAMLASDKPIYLACPEASGVWFSRKIEGYTDKYKGVCKEDVDAEIRSRRLNKRADTLFLCEADGAKRKSLKAYADHEPVIPETTDLLLILFGLKGLGQELSEDTVHRAAIFSEWTGLLPGEKIQFEHLARTLDNGAFLKAVPPTARLVAIFNQADLMPEDTKWDELAERALKQPRLDGVFFTSMLEDSQPSLHHHTKYGLIRKESQAPHFAAVVMAAGLSSRMGKNKLLLPLRGKPVLAHCLENVAASGVNEIVLVTGHDDSEIEAIAREMTGNLPSGIRLKIIFNPDYMEGQGSSVAVGSRALSEETAAAFYVPADQPFISPVLMRQMMEMHQKNIIMLPNYRGKNGSPVLFDRNFLPELSELSGELGGRQVINRHSDALRTISFDLGLSFLDLDDPEDYKAALEAAENL